MIRSSYFAPAPAPAVATALPSSVVANNVYVPNNAAFLPPTVHPQQHPPPTLAPASQVLQEFKCDSCQYKSFRVSDVELHKRLLLLLLLLFEYETTERFFFRSVHPQTGGLSTSTLSSDLGFVYPQQQANPSTLPTSSRTSSTSSFRGAFPCDRCSASFSQKAHLEGHRQAFHSGDKV